MKKRKKIFDCKPYQSCIKKNSDKIWLPSDIKYKNVINDTWFQINRFSNRKIKNKIIFENENEYPDEVYTCKKVELKLTDIQKTIFNKWFDANTFFYNYATKFIKKYYAKHKKMLLNFRLLRDNYLKPIKHKIVEDSQIESIKKNTKIKVNILDRAIKLVCTNIKSSMTNFRNGNIKKFRIRYLRYNSKKRIMEIEPTYFRDNTICKTIFGNIKAEYNNKPFNLNIIREIYKSACKLQFNDGKYYLFVPKCIETVKNENKREFIAIDPGVRTFLTCITDNEVIKVEHNDKFENYLERLDNTEKITKKSKQKKKQKLYRRKIENLRDELHWKIINYMTNKYRNILIGDMSVKKIISTDNNLHLMTKRVATSLCLFKFKQRLENKCLAQKINYKEIDESYTTKICSRCGWRNETIGGSKIFNCLECKQSYDRDVNACRGILLKAKYL